MIHVFCDTETTGLGPFGMPGRHTYISLSRELELPMEIVISNTGDTPATILKYYSKPSPEFVRRIIEERKLFEVEK